MVWLYRQINDVRSHALWDGMKDKILTEVRIAEYNRQHRKLYEALCNRDVDAATGIIAAHLEKARRDLLGVDAP
jgi:DNA-binding GntR family transcriptional regulator